MFWTGENTYAVVHIWNQNDEYFSGSFTECINWVYSKPFMEQQSYTYKLIRYGW